MKSIITNGVLLSKTKFGDNKIIVNVYTESLGKISCSILGTSKADSKMNSHLQYGRVLRLFLVKANSYYRIANLQTIQSFDYFYTDYNRSIYLFTIMELINKIYESEYIDERIFSFFVKSLEFFSNSKLSDLAKFNCILIKIISLNGIYGTHFFEAINIFEEKDSIETARSCKYSEIDQLGLIFNNEVLTFKKLIMFIEDEFEINLKSTQALLM